MPKYRRTGSYLVEVEAKDLDEAFDLIEEMKIKDFIWENTREFGEVDE